jgi:hypothetical protein
MVTYMLKTFIVMDGVEGVCVDPGEMGAILESGGLGPPGGGKGRQLASDSGGGQTLRDASEHRGRARHNTKRRLCTE